MRVATVLGILLLLAGCTSPTEPAATTPTDDARVPRPQQVLSETDRTNQCTGPATGEFQFPFEVHPEYDQIEVSWHVSGVGLVGFRIEDPQGQLVTGQDDKAPDNHEPCSHAHEGDASTFDVKPGNFTATVSNVGLVGWHLLVNEKSSKSNATGEHH